MSHNHTLEYNTLAYKFSKNQTTASVVVFTGHQMVEFQPRTWSTLYRCAFSYCYVSFLMDNPHPLLLPSDVPPPLPVSVVCLCHHQNRIIRPPGCPPSLSQNTKNLSPSLLSPITNRERLILPSLAQAKDVGLPSLPLPKKCLYFS